LPAVTGLGGDLQIVGVEELSGTVTIRYSGPEKLIFGVELTLKDNPLIKTVKFE